MNKPLFTGGKGGSKSKSPTRTPDSLRSEDTVEVILGISEGPIRGLVDGPKSFMIGDTPLRNRNGDSNFDSFELNLFTGSPLGEPIASKLGGFASSTTVSTSLASGVAVVRQGQTRDIDFLEVRLVFHQLYKQNDKGIFKADAEITIEYKAASSPEWLYAFDNAELADSSNSFYGSTTSTAVASPGDRRVFWGEIDPGTQPAGSLWVAGSTPSLSNIHTSNGSGWVQPSGLVELLAGAKYSWTENNTTVTLHHTSFLQLGETAPRLGDIWLKPSTENTSYTYNGSSWIRSGTEVVEKADLLGVGKVPAKAPPPPGVMRIHGKTTSPYVKEVRWPVPRVAEGYDIRVTKVSPDTTTEYFCEVAWESFQEVVATTFEWPNLAVAHLLAKATDQFSSIPDFSGDYEGRIVRVPTNYDPVARTYSGVWDGTYKLEYTNNPAWIVLDLVENAEYGLSRYQPIQLDKWTVYEAAKWCDVMVPDGQGGTQPRFTYNDYIADPRPGKEHIVFLCGLFGGRFADNGNGFASIRLDDDAPAVMLFTPENVVEGDFSYSYTDTTTRYNDITVSFINPDLNWQEDRRRVADEAHIAEYGRIPHDFAAVGATNAAEAMRRARHKLITGITETEQVQFKTNRQGLYLEPYNIILCADPEMGTGLSGRVLQVVAPNRFTLRDPVFLEDGLTYVARFFRTNPNYPDTSDERFVVEERTVDASLSGEVMALSFTTDLPPLAENAVFVLENLEVIGLAKPYRVLSIEEVEGDPDQVTISGVFVNRTKWSYIDGDSAIIEAPAYSTFSSGRVAPITSLTVRADIRLIGNRTVKIVALEWGRSPSKLLRGYQVLMGRNTDPMALVGETRDQIFEFEDLPPGDYVFGVRAVDISGRMSDPVLVTQSILGEVRRVTPVSGLKMLDEPSGTVFESISPVFTWDDGEGDPYSLDYKIRVINTDNQVVLHEDHASSRTWKYEHSVNVAAGGGVAPRNLTVEVSRRDQFHNVSDPVSIQVTNEAPAAPGVVEAGSGSFSIFTSIPTPTIRDFGGMVVHASTSQGFTPSPSTKVYEGPQTAITFPRTAGTWYVQAAAYDLYSTQDLNFAEAAPVTVNGSGSLDVDPPGMPSNLTVLAGPSLLFLQWTNPSDDDLSFVEVWRGPNSDIANATFVGASLAASHVDDNLTPGTTYWVFLRAVDRAGNKSGFTSGVSASPIKITGTHISDGAITTPHLAANSVLAGNIGAGEVTAEKISITDLAAINVTVKNADIESLTIGGEKIQNNAISNSVSAVATTSATAGNGTEILSVSLPTTGSNPVYILVTASIVGPYNEVGESATKVPGSQKLTLQRNGVDLESANYTGTTEGTEEIHTIVFVDQAPVQGSATTYSILAFGNGTSSGPGSVVVKRRSVLAMELKK